VGRQRPQPGHAGHVHVEHEDGVGLGQQVGPLHGGVQRMAGGEVDAVAEVDDRRRQRLGQQRQLVDRPRVPADAPGHDDGSLGGGQQLGHLLERRHVRGRCPGRHQPARGGGRRPGEGVARQRHVGQPGGLGPGHLECPADEQARVAALGQVRGPLGGGCASIREGRGPDAQRGGVVGTGEEDDRHEVAQDVVERPAEVEGRALHVHHHRLRQPAGDVVAVRGAHGHVLVRAQHRLRVGDPCGLSLGQRRPERRRVHHRVQEEVGDALVVEDRDELGGQRPHMRSPGGPSLIGSRLHRPHRLTPLAPPARSLRSRSRLCTARTVPLAQ